MARQHSVPRLLAVSDRRTLAGQDLVGWARGLAAAGVDGLWLREKDLPDRDLYELATEVRAAFPPPGRLLVAARPDLALAVAADGVHLPADGLPTAQVRERWGGELLVGRSTHSLEEVEQAGRAGAGYVTFGPVFDSPAKRGLGAPTGVDALAAACRLGVSVLALGGVMLLQLDQLAVAGAHGIAAIRLFQDPTALPTVVQAHARAFAERQENTLR